MREEGLDSVAEQRSDVRDLLLDVPAIRSPQSGHGDAGIEDSYVASLPDERLDQRDHGALSEVVGPGLEGEADDSNPLSSRLEHRLHRPSNLPLVRGEDRGEKR